MHGCLLYYITDRTAFASDEPTRCRRLLEKVKEAARAGVDYIQLRERNLSTRELECLAREAVHIVREATNLAPAPRPLAPVLLINSRTDVALATGADGVHLRSDDVSPQTVRTVWRASGAGTAARVSPQPPLIGVSCHSPREVAQAAEAMASFAIFGPVFEKKDAPGTKPAGLVQLREACNAKIPVLALGGVALENARECLEAGAAGIAAIRLFQENEMGKVVDALRLLDR
jgi:thiamine-phosphate pyrophosphorylase